ncbi:RsmE family RNA methyltransferase [Entomobacter blattae]|uniref:Ribosomal RNA small subunit methyltransferase E n=1 Tax=Entomobacter blattae TaxID=2762277 RepID=A0A7H1NQG4_9PROT|nr:RsmE family RNA methyltransferase [Entomobacter blattae]QNT78024.1 Ribosomal RNA small subunit methyltransferase E [Entomobacter blattae]
MQTLPRVYYHFTKSPYEGQLCPLPVEIMHYLVSVMRCGVSDRIRLFNAQAGEWEAELVVTDRKKGHVRLISQARPPVTVEADPVLAFAPLKREATDLVVRMGTELGVGRFAPVICAHSNTHKVKEERWQVIAREAAEQCERMDLPTFEPLQAVEAFLQTWPPNKILAVAVERMENGPYLEPQSLLVQRIRQGLPIADGVLIGPEGGFSPGEKKYFFSLPFVVPLSLGPCILRAETAAVTALGLLQCWPSVEAWSKIVREGQDVSRSKF